MAGQGEISKVSPKVFMQDKVLNKQRKSKQKSDKGGEASMAVHSSVFLNAKIARPSSLLTTVVDKDSQSGSKAFSAQEFVVCDQETNQKTKKQDIKSPSVTKA